MRNRLFIIGISVFITSCTVRAAGRDVTALGQATPPSDQSIQQVWQGLNLRITAEDILSQKTGANQNVLVCRGTVSLSVARHSFSGDSAVVWIDANEPNSVPPKYVVHAYIKGNLSRESSAEAAGAGIQEFEIEPGESMVVKMTVGPEVYVTAEKREVGSPRGLLLYREAVAALESVGIRQFSEPEAAAPVKEAPTPEKVPQPPAGSAVIIAPRTGGVWTAETQEVNNVKVDSIVGGVYASWQEEVAPGREPRRFEVEADGLVMWRRPSDANATGDEMSGAFTRNEQVSAIFVEGDVVVREGPHVIRATEFYYDLLQHRGIGANVLYRTYEPSRAVPIYVRAARFRQTAVNQFEANDVTLTTSEFATPQLSMNAGSIRVIDLTQAPEPVPEADSKGRFDAQMKDIQFKYYDTTIFAWPSLHTNAEAPDVPIKSIHVASDSTYGTSIETSWYLSRLMGLKEPEGTDSSLLLDYYSKRGPAAGVDVAYERENYFGRFLAYGLEDHGEDRLSRTQKQVDVSKETRGRFKFQHRQFLPDSWQLTAEASYASDQNFLQQFYRDEFNSGKEQETLLHLKRIEDNTGFAFLTKARINDFQNQIEELPSADYHWTGQSFWDDRLTFYSDSQVSRYRYRYSSSGTAGDPDNFFTFTTTRNEVDLPLTFAPFKVVPYAAGTFAYDDGTGFRSDLNNFQDEPQNSIGVGEAGVRTAVPSIWRVYDAQSELLDLNGLRHVMTPGLSVASFAASDPEAEQRNVLNLELFQRLQTKRGPKANQRTVNWVEWDTQMVWVDHSTDAETTGPDQLLWNKPFIPLVDRTTEQIPPQDRRTTSIFGARRNYIENTWIVRATDTTAVLGDMNFDTNSGIFQQVNVGFSRLCWPDLSYYVGSRYLRRLVSGRERGSNAVTFAVTYVLDPRYTAVFSQQYDFDYEAGIRSDITLIRRYHQLNLAVTLSSDESLDEQRIVFSLWPQGVPELSLGLRQYSELGAVETY
jgi:hypothetical protein